MCRNQLKHLRRVSRHGAIKAFTLVEILVVVAIIALLVAILLPSLAKAREQARVALCSSNLHQQALGMMSYGEDFNGSMPARGFWSYTITEVEWEAYGPLGGGSQTYKVPINLGLLHGDERKTKYTSYIGKDWNLLYCPSLVGDKKNDVVQFAQNDGFGWFETRWEKAPPGPRFTYAGYDYALPVAQRNSGFGPQKKFVYPRDMLSKRWLAALAQAQGYGDVDEDDSEQYRYKVMLHAMQTVAMDLTIGSRKEFPHRNGLNALYSDGHVRFHQMKKQHFLTYSLLSNEMWHYVTMHP